MTIIWVCVWGGGGGGEEGLGVGGGELSPFNPYLLPPKVMIIPQM